MNGLNKLMIIGNLGGNPELRYTPSGSPVASFNVAVNRTYSGGKTGGVSGTQGAGGTDGGRKEETEWFTVVTWNKQAESCNECLSKGSQVYVEGRVHTRSWEDQGGQKHTRTEIIASQVIFLTKKNQVEDDDFPEIDIPF
jgi:single-strand DNA-binding protein